ncbi:NAD-glutamate dehydrogenase domain-containing protein [Pontiella sp.]|uniref:NAD-glutamate dehydrogenase domain-containing protein n=1 Tax=Pontiella sp. TaxID=2837462 RepID=UPI00356466BD
MKTEDTSAIAHEINAGFSESIREIVTAFYASMPQEYFEKVSREAQKDHLRTIIAGTSLNIPQDHFRLKDSRDQYTFISLKNRPGQLVEFLRQLPEDLPLTSADVFTSADNQFVVDIFSFAPRKETPLLEEKILQRMAGTEAIDIRVEHQADRTAVQIVADNAETTTILKRLAAFFASLGLDIRNVELHNSSAYADNIAVIRFTASLTDPSADLVHDINRLLRLDEGVLQLADEHTVSFELAELLIAFCNIIQHQLSHLDRIYFTYECVERTLLDYADVVFPELQQLLDRRGVSAPDGRVGADQIAALSSKSQVRQILSSFYLLRASVLSSNLDADRRLALALSIGPGFFEQSPFDSLPLFAVYYIFGNRFQGYHVRFDNIARGGLRILCPAGMELYSHQNDHLFEEAYGLASAQHFKNKDIPEGGSKAALLVRPGHPPEKAGRAFVDALLDLNLKDYPELSELVFLGPDENVSNNLINWAIERAAQKAHPLPACFMSSKPGAGINHKEYGITSEGVNVYLEQALLYKGTDPAADPFTVKMTGGTNGDVAGNLVKILIRDYGKNVRFLGLADGTAAVEDPAGLSHRELLRLVHEDLPLIAFDPAALSADGALHDAGERDGEKLRNSMHNRVVSDVFLTGGGRPKTINGYNWQDFLQDDGTPSARIIVEGANLFLTASARQFLSEKGVLIFKDSSANKCGVICSSFEILAGMLLTQEEFLAHKEPFVAEVVGRLRKLARLEARVLLRTHRLNPQLTLPDISIRLSEVINHVAQVIYAHIQEAPDMIELMKTVADFYIPPMLRHRLSNIEQSEYCRKLLAAIVSAKMVYTEGIEFFEGVADDEIIRLVREYLSYEPEIQGYMDAIEKSTLPDKEQILRLIRKGGVSTAFRERL